MIRSLLSRDATILLLHSPRRYLTLRDRYNEIDEETYDAHVSECITEIMDPNEGPLTNFVILSRAIDLAREDRFSGQYSVNDVIANALAIILEKRGLSL